MASAAFAAFCVLAVLDWIAVAQRRKPLEYVTKPGALIALLVWAATGSSSPWLLAALFFGLLGDVFLMLPADLFVAGLLAFLIGHLAYVAAFHPPPGRAALSLLIILAVLSPIAMRIVRGARQPALRVAIVVYSVVIGTMAASAIASGNTLAIGGALLFVVSDMLIAWSRFVTPYAWAPVAIIVTYHVGQFGLAAALRG